MRRGRPASLRTPCGGSNLTMGLPEGSAYYVQHFDGALKDLRLGVALTTLPGLSGDYGKT